MKMKISRTPLATAALAAASCWPDGGCMVGPDYHRPAGAACRATYRELPGWTQAEPAADGPKGDWWTGFNDPLLDQLEPMVSVSNQTVRQDYANYQEALAEVRVARARLFPTIGVTGSVTRARSATGSLEQQPLSSGVGNFQAVEQLGLARRQCELGAGPVGRGAPHDRRERRDRPGERSDACQCDLVRADRARHRGHRPAHDATRISTCCSTLSRPTSSLCDVVADQDRAGTVAALRPGDRAHPARNRAVQPDRAWRRARPIRARDCGAGRQESGRPGHCRTARRCRRCRRFRSACLRRCCSAGRTSRPPNGRWPRRMPRSAWRWRRITRRFRCRRWTASRSRRCRACCTSANYVWSLGGSAERNDLRRRRAQCAKSRRRRRATTRRSRITAAPC